ncbi:MAG TPA: glycoside hydrolase domain-containing protein [Bauldia sp.]|nr:glycoside hydrolase domain-containing protein [Bauldia sp.]
MIRLGQSIAAAALSIAVAGNALASGSHRSEDHCRPRSGVYAADTSQPVTPAFLKKMRQVGVRTIIRYFDHKNETFRGKTLTFEERMQIAEAGFNLLVVFQHWGQRISTFRDQTRGKTDAIRALALAHDVGQPVGSAIYFAVDGPWSSPKDTADIVRYFTDVRRTVAMRGNLYRIGVYGSGHICSEILDRGLADFCWLANAKAWPGYDTHLASGRWAMRQLMPGKCGDREVDFNLVPRDAAYFGEFR